MAQDFDPSNSASGSSSPWKWVALGCGGCLVLSTAVVVVLSLVIGRTMKFAIGPEGVNAETAPFTYTMPGESTGVLAMKMFGMEITQITSTDTPPSVLLTMGRLPGYLQNPADQTTFIESFQEGMVGDQNYQFSQPRTEERPLCGSTVPVIVQTGDYQENQVTYPTTSLMAAVDHNSRTQFVWILAHGETATANADQVFSSLECQ